MPLAHKSTFRARCAPADRRLLRLRLCFTASKVSCPTWLTRWRYAGRLGRFVIHSPSRLVAWAGGAPVWQSFIIVRMSKESTKFGTTTGQMRHAASGAVKTMQTKDLPHQIVGFPNFFWVKKVGRFLVDNLNFLLFSSSPSQLNMQALNSGRMSLVSRLLSKLGNVFFASWEDRQNSTLKINKISGVARTTPCQNFTQITQSQWGLSVRNRLF